MRRRVLLLSRYEDRGASSRLRSYQYLPYLRAEGLAITVQALMSNAYLDALYAGQGRRLDLRARAYVRRALALARAGRYDVLWIEKELFPMLPAWAERALGALGVPYVVDYDDAIFHNYDRSRITPVRALMGRKIDVVMGRSAVVVAGNPYLADRAREAGARRVEIVPTVIDLERYPRVPPAQNAVFTIGWIGTPVTAKYLDVVRPALEALHAEGPVRVVTIGPGQVDLGAVPVEVRPWSEAGEVADLQSLDVGIMPLPDTPWERGKCGYKLIQYMGCALPVVASPVGVNVDIVTEGVNGYLAGDSADWVAALRALRDDPARRRDFGEAGRARVEGAYALQVTAPRWRDLLMGAG